MILEYVDDWSAIDDEPAASREAAQVLYRHSSRIRAMYSPASP